MYKLDSSDRENVVKQVSVWSSFIAVIGSMT